MCLAVQIKKRQMKKTAQPVSWPNCLLDEIYYYLQLISSSACAIPGML